MFPPEYFKQLVETAEFIEKCRKEIEEYLQINWSDSFPNIHLVEDNWYNIHTQKIMASYTVKGGSYSWEDYVHFDFSEFYNEEDFINEVKTAMERLTT